MRAAPLYRWVPLVVALGLSPARARAEVRDPTSLVEYVRGRDDLAPATRRSLERAVRLRFGGAALEPGSEARPELAVAKAILSAAIFMRTEEKRAVDAAWAGWHGAQGFVPPPIAIHYQLLTLEGRQPRGRPIDLAFHFPDYYNEEIAPELVAYWEEALAAGKIPDDALTETREALEATRLKMRPLLLDKLRLMARLAREQRVAKGTRPAEIRRDLAELDAELTRSFSRVARRPEVLDARRRPYDRLRIQLEDMGLSPTAEDRGLDPDAATPAPRPVPKIVEPAVPTGPDGSPLEEPTGEPVPVLPDQPTPWDPRPSEDPVSGRSKAALMEAYARQLAVHVQPWLGTPYRWGNAARGVGTDCSGYSQAVMASAFAASLPRTSIDQFRVGISVERRDLRPGDLLFFDMKDAGRVSHVAVYAGQGRFSHAAVKAGVTYDQLAEKHYQRSFRGARRLLAYPD
jgi:hypothetical protein